ncbi:src-like-adapter 2 [Fundulus diaphanus]
MGTCFTRCRCNRTVLGNQPEPPMPGLQESVIVALYDYPEFERTELTMRMGERLTIVSDDGDFMMVRSTSTGRESYIPTNYTARVTDRWLYTGISRYQAEELLKHPSNQTGAFLIRESETNTDSYSLSILRRTSSLNMNPVKHYRITQLENSWVYISPGLTFSSLHYLVEHYAETPDGLCCRLTAPCFIQGQDDPRPVPITVRRPTMNWREISRSAILRRKRTESDNSLVSDGLREAISSYLQLTECNDHSWDT